MYQGLLIQITHSLATWEAAFGGQKEGGFCQC